MAFLSIPVQLWASLKLMSDKSSELLQLLAGQMDSPSGDESGSVPAGQGDLRLLKSGAISLDEFLDLAVDRALAHLEGHVDHERMVAMRTVLRESLQSDPSFAALVAQISKGVAASTGAG